MRGSRPCVPWVPAFAGMTGGVSLRADLPKPLSRSSRAADMRWCGLKDVSSPAMTLVRKRAMERPSSVSSRMTLASSVSNFVGSRDLRLRVLDVESWGLSSTKSGASSLP